jgi:hypothetical protein
MTGLVPVIHAFLGGIQMWMAGSRPSAGPAMTISVMKVRAAFR